VSHNDQFVIGRNPDKDSSLPYILQFYVDRRDRVTLKARESWPKEDGAVYCYPLPEWPKGAQRIDSVRVRSCRRRGPTIDIVLERKRHARSSIVYTNKMIFWQSVRSVGSARPDYRLAGRSRPEAGQLVIAIDTREQMPFSFQGYDTELDYRSLRVGDYAVFDGTEMIASVERKNRIDFIRAIKAGELAYQLAQLETERTAALVVEAPYMWLFEIEDRAIKRRSREAELAARLQARYKVPIVFAGPRFIAQEWTFRFLAAAAADHASEASLSGAS